MRLLLFLLLFFSLQSCKEVRRKPSIMASPDPVVAVTPADTSFQIEPIDSVVEISNPAPSKKPNGVYRFSMPEDSFQIEHIIQFSPNNTYRLQETFHPGNKVVTTEGNWSPSDGDIWLYRQQVARGRYKWKGDTLQYFSPSKNKAYSLQQLPWIMENTTWQERAKKGFVFFGVGNEPFWSIEGTRDSQLVFRLAEWETSRSFAMLRSSNANGSRIYEALNDSSSITLTILPRFCSDGMSDFIYPKMFQVVYNQQTYMGCGVIYR